jgi:hypothetical protein
VLLLLLLLLLLLIINFYYYKAASRKLARGRLMSKYLPQLQSLVDNFNNQNNNNDNDYDDNNNNNVDDDEIEDILLFIRQCASKSLSIDVILLKKLPLDF